MIFSKIRPSELMLAVVLYFKMSHKTENVKFEEAIEQAGFGKYSIFIIIITGMTSCISMMSSLDVSFLLPSAECDFQLTSEDKGLLGSAYYFGILSTSHLSGFLADTLGRRYVLLRSLSLTTLTYILGAFAPDFSTFVILKAVLGVASSPCMIASVPYLGEFVPVKKRSQAILIMTSMSSVGVLYTSLIGWATLRETWEVDLIYLKFRPWRLFYLMCALPSMLTAFLFYISPESPKFLLARGKMEDTTRVLQLVHGFNSGSLPETYPIKSVIMDSDEILAPGREKGAAGILKLFKDQTLPLLQPPYLRNILVTISLYFLCLFCVNSIALWIPEVTNRMVYHHDTHDGDNRYTLCEIMSQHAEAVRQTNLTNSVCETSANAAMFVPNVIQAILQPVFMVFISLVVPYVDRRYFIMALYILSSGMALGVTKVASAFTIVLFGGILMLLGFAFNIISTVVVELFPTYLRAMAVSLNIVCGRVGSIVGSYFFSYMIYSDCLLLFRIVSGLILCATCIPLFFKLEKKVNQEIGKLDLPTTKTIA